MISNIFKKILVYANVGSAFIMAILFIDLLNYTVHKNVSYYDEYLLVSSVINIEDAIFYVGLFSAISVLFSMIMLIQNIGKKITAISILVPSLFILLCMITLYVINIIELNIY